MGDARGRSGSGGSGTGGSIGGPAVQCEFPLLRARFWPQAAHPLAGGGGPAKAAGGGGPGAGGGSQPLGGARGLGIGIPGGLGGSAFPGIAPASEEEVIAAMRKRGVSVERTERGLTVF